MDMGGYGYQFSNWSRAEGSKNIFVRFDKSAVVMPNSAACLCMFVC